MRTAVPLSLLTVGLVRADTDGIVVLGPFSSVTCMDAALTGRRYPDDAADEMVVLARYEARVDRWVTPDGCPLVMWSVGSVDDALHCGCPEEQRKAGYIRSEFPAEAAATPKEG